MVGPNKTISHHIEAHVNLLRDNIPDGKSSFRSIYDFPVYTNIFIDDIKFFSQILPINSKVLDLGCGRGTSSYVLNKIGYKVVGIEVEYENYDEKLTSYVFPAKLQEPLWNKTIEETGGDTLSFTFYNGKTFPFAENSFDAIFAYAVLEHVENLSQTLKEINRILKPNGILFISRTPNKYSYSEWLARVLKMPAHENLYTKAEITNFLSNEGFEIDSLDLIDFFPSNIPFINKYYQRLGDLLLFLDKLVRYTPINFISHHFRIVAKKI